MRPAAEDAVKARDKAIVDRLKIAPASFDALVAVLPQESGHSAADREAACRSAVIRLGVKKVIRSVEGGAYAIA